MDPLHLVTTTATPEQVRGRWYAEVDRWLRGTKRPGGTSPSTGRAPSAAAAHAAAGRVGQPPGWELVGVTENAPFTDAEIPASLRSFVHRIESCHGG